MSASAGGFSIRSLTASSDKAEVERAIHIFERNTPPDLRTNSDEIRAKIAAPALREGTRYFAVLYRGPTLIGFAMSGYYPSRKIAIIDHMVIDDGKRGDSAFSIFTGLLIEEMSDLAPDYVVIEVESKSENRAAGIVMMRRLTRNEFGRAEVKYYLPATDTDTLGLKYDGALMLRSMHEAADDFVKIKKREIERIVETVYFKHYYDWYQDVWSAPKVKLYKTYIDALFREFKSGIQGESVSISHYVREAAPVSLHAHSSAPDFGIPPRNGLGYHFSMFAATAAVCGIAIYLLKIPPIWVPVVLIAFMVVFAGVVLVASGNASKVFDASLSVVRKGRGRKPRSLS